MWTLHCSFMYRCWRELKNLREAQGYVNTQLKVVIRRSVTTFVFDQRQSGLKHFVLNWAFLRFTDFIRRKCVFSPPSSPCNVVPLYTKHPNFEWRVQGRGVDSFALWSYPIWVECLNNTVADCWWLKTSAWLPTFSICMDFSVSWIMFWYSFDSL